MRYCKCGEDGDDIEDGCVVCGDTICSDCACYFKDDDTVAYCTGCFAREQRARVERNARRKRLDQIVQAIKGVKA